MKFTFRWLTAAACAMTGSAFAQVVDQQDLNDNANMANFSQTDLAQSFQQSASDIDGAAIFLEATIGDQNPGNITIQLYDNLPNAGGNLLTQGTVNGITAGNWAMVTWSDLHITAGQEYYLVFTSTNNSLGVAGDVGNGYPFGNVYANPGYQSFASFDYTFQTYHASSAPEPVSCSLLGLGALALIKRRRR